MGSQIALAVALLFSLGLNCVLAASIFRLSKVRASPTPALPSEDLMQLMREIISSLVSFRAEMNRLSNDDFVTNYRGKRRRGSRSKK